MQTSSAIARLLTFFLILYFSLSRPDLDRITSDTARNFAEKYIGVGEFVFDSSMAAAHASQFFKKTSANSNAQIPSPLAKLAETTQQNSGSSSWWK